MLGFLTAAIAAARLLGPHRPNATKAETYECGQEPIGEAREYRMLGIARYFGYAVVFFAVDAFAWVALTAAYAPRGALAPAAVYVAVVMIGVAYFLAEARRLAR